MAGAGLVGSAATRDGWMVIGIAGGAGCSGIARSSRGLLAPNGLLPWACGSAGAAAELAGALAGGMIVISGALLGGALGRSALSG